MIGIPIISKKGISGIFKNFRKFSEYQEFLRISGNSRSFRIVCSHRIEYQPLGRIEYRRPSSIWLIWILQKKKNNTWLLFEHSQIPKFKKPKIQISYRKFIQVANFPFLHSNCPIFTTPNHLRQRKNLILSNQYVSLGNGGEHCNYSTMFYLSYHPAVKMY
jgi:hypothetical protein